MPLYNFAVATLPLDEDIGLQKYSWGVGSSLSNPCQIFTLPPPKADTGEL